MSGRIGHVAKGLCLLTLKDFKLIHCVMRNNDRFGFFRGQTN